MTDPKRIARKAHDAEHRVTKRAARHREHPVLRAAGQAAELGDQPPLVAVNLLTIAAGLALRRPDVVRTGVRMLAAHALATGIKAAIKANFDRTRPHAKLAGKRDRLGPGDHNSHDHNSFPSGHTAGAVAVAAAVARDRPELGGAAYGTAAAIAGVQVPRGSHYASDVAAGALIGWLAEKLTSAALDRAGRAFRPARTAARADPDRPPSAAAAAPGPA